jgi:4-hydroxythreonine-4-phosphate dehydrogenase
VAVAEAARGERPMLLVGEPWVIERAARVVGVDPGKIVSVTDPARERGVIASGHSVIAVYRPPLAGALHLAEAPLGRPTPSAGRAQLQWLDAAMDLAARGIACALVTGPVSKHAIASSGVRGAASFRGHTEYLARRLGSTEVIMAFWSERLTISLVTTHLPLARVPRAITPKAVAAACFHTARLAQRVGRKHPRIAVTALNPHAGEGGLLGNEESTRIGPGIELARRRLTRSPVPAKLDGPLGAETAVRMAYAGAFDGVVAMYHDQATIPMKLIGFGDAVNVTLGLPIVRTSVDHGTGYDKAGQGKASPSGMRAAVELAWRLGVPGGR